MRIDKIKAGLAAAAVVCIAAGTLCIRTTTAYLTDNESALNLFTVGKVEAALNEPDFPGNDDEAVKNLVPNREVPKNPSVTNTGVNDMIVFMAVQVPTDDITIVDDNGRKGEKGVSDLFWLKLESDDISFHSNHFDENWIPLTERTVISDTAGTPSLYVFGYGSIMPEGGQTTALFDKVQLKNIIENEVSPGTVLEIKVEAYAIQASDILGSDEDLAAGLTEADLDKIYDIYLNQSGM